MGTIATFLVAFGYWVLQCARRTEVSRTTVRWKRASRFLLNSSAVCHSLAKNTHASQCENNGRFSLEKGKKDAEYIHIRCSLSRFTHAVQKLARLLARSLTRTFALPASSSHVHPYTYYAQADKQTDRHTAADRRSQSTPRRAAEIARSRATGSFRFVATRRKRWEKLARGGERVLASGLNRLNSRI